MIKFLNKIFDKYCPCLTHAKAREHYAVKENIGFEMKCFVCNYMRTYSLYKDDLFGDKIILTCWYCNDYQIHIERDGVKHTFRHGYQEALDGDKDPYYRFKEVKI